MEKKSNERRVYELVYEPILCYIFIIDGKQNSCGKWLNAFDAVLTLYKNDKKKYDLHLHTKCTYGNATITTKKES